MKTTLEKLQQYFIFLIYCDNNILYQVKEKKAPY